MDFKMKNKKLLEYIKRSTSPFHVVLESEHRLVEAGFEELVLTDSWTLKQGGKYYVKVYGTTLFAFTIGEQLGKTINFRIAAAHTDHPCFKIKPNAEMVDNNYLKLNTDVYGGPIVNTWLDRPLSIAGKVVVRSNQVFKPEIRYVDFSRPLLTIPNLAIHMNRQVNKGVELNQQTETLPVIGLVNETLNKDNFFLELLAKELEITMEDILDFDLYLYNTESGYEIGMNQDMILSPRLDNLTSCFALLEAIAQETRTTGVNVIVLFDNEEIGSKTKQGADSNIMTFILEKINYALGYQHIDYYNSILNSLFLSVDVAHAIHPNFSTKSDPTNKVKMNEGFAIKLNSNQRYATDSEAVGIVVQICEENNIKYQKYVNRSDVTGGGTLGSITSSYLPMKTVDLGIPMLAMHSACETMGSKDQKYLEDLIRKFLSIEA